MFFKQSIYNLFEFFSSYRQMSSNVFCLANLVQLTNDSVH